MKDTVERYNLGSRWTDTPASGDRQVACMDKHPEGEFVTYQTYSDLEDDYDLQCQCRDAYRQENIELKLKLQELASRVRVRV